MIWFTVLTDSSQLDLNNRKLIADLRMEFLIRSTKRSASRKWEARRTERSAS